ncbi:unnamed protein product [Polarella glacialis]|uniref:Methyltransferase FkbM domain-containing protein n=1 Tax=Polarella glacialis TaxID=89957 RepID=A0A813FD96_POLGL|nr:unnamed protein product [Polarella glacialis]|mmetsp:Transcript_50531/g.81968  ORF Transcript_50531/g.81968 Transcript_50531/m.81968 type:complete len:286 (-) Transcript_50531:277-1134(-)
MFFFPRTLLTLCAALAAASAEECQNEQAAQGHAMLQTSRSSKPADCLGLGDAAHSQTLQFYSQHSEDKILLEQMFCGMRNKTYLEMGALDGVMFSNSKFYEDTMGWSGILIEAQPRNAARLLKNRPKSKNFPMAVCKEGVGHLTFRGSGPVAGVEDDMSDDFKARFHIKDADTRVQVPCKPLSRIVQDADTKHIDFFSLDVEGGELSVLETMDWDVPVCVWLVELDGTDPDKDQSVRQLMAQHGYAEQQVAGIWHPDRQAHHYTGGGDNSVFTHSRLEKCLSGAL